MARSVSDVRLIFEACAGLDWGDVRSVDLPIRKMNPSGVPGRLFDDNGIAPVTPENSRGPARSGWWVSERGNRSRAIFPNGPRRILRICSCSSCAMWDRFSATARGRIGWPHFSLVRDYWTKALARPQPTFCDLVLAGPNAIKCV